MNVNKGGALVLWVLMQPIWAQSGAEHMACIEKLEVPLYPALAAQARIAGTVTANVKLNPGGTVNTISLSVEAKTKSAKGVLGPPVESALRSSSYRGGCEAKPITLVFDFVLGENFLPNGQKQKVIFEYPNRFTIITPAMPWMPESARH